MGAWVLPHYDVAFSGAILRCAGEQEVATLVQILLRSKVKSLTIAADEPFQFVTDVGHSAAPGATPAEGKAI